MQFLRNNIFYVGLIAGVIVVGLVFVLIGRSISDDVSANVKLRTDISRGLAALGGKPYVNRRVIDARAKAVKDTKDKAAEVSGKCIHYAMKNYQLLQIPEYKDKDGEEVSYEDAFPIIAPTAAKRFYISAAYCRRLKEMLRELHATDVPTKQEIEKAVKRVELRLLKEQELEKRRKRLITGEGTPTAAAGAGGMEMEGVGRAMPPAGRLGAAPVVQAGTEAIARGTIIAKVSKSQKGQINANIDSFHVLFHEGVADATDQQLWEAQENLWITSDIVRAICRTIKNSLEDIGKKKRRPATVPNSAIKHLLNIAVVKGYILAPGAGQKTVARSKRKSPGRGEMGMMEEMGDYGRGPGASGEKISSAHLTGRHSNPRYAVKHYSFTVIMNPRFALALQNNLLKQNYHTILDVSYEAIDQTKDSLYYYGSDPVVKVTIKGELLLLSDWHRGTWLPGENRKKGQWSTKFPPIMPRRVLAEIKSEDESALRKEDKQRLLRKGK